VTILYMSNTSPLIGPDVFISAGTAGLGGDEGLGGANGFGGSGGSGGFGGNGTGSGNDGDDGLGGLDGLPGLPGNDGFGGTGGSVGLLSVVPEPTTWSMLATATGLGGARWWRCRRRRRWNRGPTQGGVANRTAQAAGSTSHG